jgi:heme/copper-type cytochrome/quinol oxidase subunit 1
MVYAMLSIGVLGFIVWSLKLASLLINNKIYFIINNFTIRWDYLLSIIYIDQRIIFLV